MGGVGGVFLKDFLGESSVLVCPAHQKLGAQDAREVSQHMMDHMIQIDETSCDSELCTQAIEKIETTDVRLHKNATRLPVSYGCVHHLA